MTPFRVCSLVVIAFIVVVAARPSHPAADDAVSPAPDVKPAPAVEKIKRSNKAVVKDVVYGLEFENGKLFLASQPLEPDGVGLKRDTLAFSVPHTDEIIEMSVTGMSTKNLMAVIKIRRGKEFEFHCLTFIAPGGGHARDKHAFYNAKFFTTPEDYKILAIGGKHYAGSAFIVLGETWTGVGKDGPEQLSEGVFYFSGCPWPPEGGALTPFHVTSRIKINTNE